MERESKPYLLDTSALLALIEDEDGADRVEELIRNQEVLLPFVVGLETYYITHRERSEDAANERLAIIRQLQVRWLDWVEESVLVMAGQFKARHHISLADALIAAFACNAGAVLVHKDPEYETLASSVEQEPLPYKNPSR